MLVRIEPPRATRADVPLDAVPALDAYYEAQDQLRRTIAALRAVSAPQSDGTRPSAYEVERARVDRDAASVAAARDALAARLTSAESTLGRPALLLLGMLRFRAAEEAYGAAFDVGAACTEAGRTDCGEAVNDDDLAVATWARVGGGDALAAWSLYERAHSASDHGSSDDARRLLEEALAIPHLPEAVEALSAFMLGELLSIDSPALAAASLTRCAGLASQGVAPHCALRAAMLLPDLDAIAVLAPFLDTPDVQEQARLFTGERFARLSSLPALDTIAAPARARALTVGAQRLAEHGMVARALAATEAARALAPSADLDALAARITAARAIDTPEAWLRRSALFCARLTDTLGLGRMRIRGRFTPQGARAITTSHVVPSALAPLAECLARAPLTPESPLRGSFRAELVLGARTDVMVPHIRRGETD